MWVTQRAGLGIEALAHVLFPVPGRPITKIDLRVVHSQSMTVETSCSHMIPLFSVNSVIVALDC